jgi:hypothetical protein
MLEPIAMILADKAMRRHVTSARPHAPVRPDPPNRRPRAEAGRMQIAVLLRRLANRIEPCSAQTCQPAA